MQGPLNIVLSSNERYMPGATVALASVVVAARPETQLHFHVFTENVVCRLSAIAQGKVLV